MKCKTCKGMGATIPMYDIEGKKLTAEVLQHMAVCCPDCEGTGERGGRRQDSLSWVEEKLNSLRLNH